MREGPYIVNVRRMPAGLPGVVYCGPARGGWPASALAVPDGMNPLDYRPYLWEAMQRGEPPAVARAMRAIGSRSILGGWTFPDPDPVATVAEVWRYFKGRGRIADPLPPALPLAAADKLLAKIVAALGASCDRIEAAGAVRRRERWVYRLAVQCVPKRTADLFGHPIGSVLDATLAALAAAWKLYPVTRGERHKEYIIFSAGVFLDVWACPADLWGYHWMKNTGPHGFSIRLMTHAGKNTEFGRGLLPTGYQSEDGAITKGGVIVPQAEEADVWAILGRDPVPPELRRSLSK